MRITKQPEGFGEGRRNIQRPDGTIKGLPPEHQADERRKNGAGNEARTRDPKLGKLVLYQLSYARPFGGGNYDNSKILSTDFAEGTDFKGFQLG